MNGDSVTSKLQGETAITGENDQVADFISPESL